MEDILLEAGGNALLDALDTMHLVQKRQTYESSEKRQHKTTKDKVIAKVGSGVHTMRCWCMKCGVFGHSLTGQV